LRGLQWCTNGHLDYGIGEGEGEQIIFYSFAKKSIPNASILLEITLRQILTKI
jgi:hypothetical protein